MTGDYIVAAALRVIGAIGNSDAEALGPTELIDGLAALNSMLSAWAAERLMIINVIIQDFNLVATTQVYTLGPGGTFNTTRPVRIERAGIINLSIPYESETPIPIYTPQQWSEISIKTVSGSLPQGVYDDGAVPLRRLSFYPIPNTASKVRLYNWTQLQSFANGQTDYTFPPAYEEAIKWNLAIRLAPEWKKRAPAEVVMFAGESKSRIKAVNTIPGLLKCDPALVRRGGYNIYTDGSR